MTATTLAERFGLTVRAPRTGMHEFEDDDPVEPYDFGEDTRRCVLRDRA